MVKQALATAERQPLVSAIIVERQATYPHNRLPRIEYRAHPAYAEATRSPSLAMRARAGARFAKGLANVLVRWASDYEHLPKPPDKARRRRWFVSRIPLYAALIARGWIARPFGRRASIPLDPAAAEVLEQLNRDGVSARPLSLDVVEEMDRLLAPHFEELERRIESIPPEAWRFDDNRLWIDPKQHAPVYCWFNVLLDQAGFVPASSVYLRRKVRVAHIIPQINRPEDDFWTGPFADIGLADTACNYCHVDTAYNVTKMIIYLGEVGPENGPFSVILGSHKVADGFLDRLVRRANDYAGLSLTGPRDRALFASLPSVLRKKCAFGPDIEDSHPWAATLLASERVFTTDRARCILFDPNAIHRGGMIRQGERRVVTILFSEAA